MVRNLFINSLGSELNRQGFISMFPNITIGGVEPDFTYATIKYEHRHFFCTLWFNKNYTDVEVLIEETQDGKLNAWLVRFSIESETCHYIDIEENDYNNDIVLKNIVSIFRQVYSS